MWPREEARRFFSAARRAAEGPADRREDCRAVRGVLLHDQGQGHVRRLLRRTARALFGPPQGVQAAEHVQRLLEGRCEESADAAHLRHGFLQRVGAERVHRADRGSEEARPSEAREGPRAVHVPSVGARSDVLARQGNRALEHARRLHARRADSSRLRGSESADHLQQGALGNVRTLVPLSARTCSSSSRKRNRWASRR